MAIEAVLGAGLFAGEEAAVGAGLGAFAGGAAEAGGLGAAGAFAGEAAGGLGLGGLAGAEAGFGLGGLAGAGAAELGGLGEAAGGLGGAGSDFGGTGGDFGGVGTGGFQADSSALEALGGQGFDAPATTQELGQGVPQFGTDLTGQSGVINASSALDVNADAIAALNEPSSLASPEISNASFESANLGSVADTPASPATDTPELSAAEPSPEEYGGQQTQSTASQGPSQTNSALAPEQSPTTQPNQSPPGTTRAAARTPAADTAGAGKFASSPLSLLQGINSLLSGKPSSPYLPQGAGYASNLGDFGNEQLAQYRSGALRPEDAATLQLQTKAALNKMRQFYAQSGNSNSTAARQAENQILAQSVAAQVQFMQQYLNSGMQSLGQAGPQLLQAANIDLQNQRSYSESLNRALGAATRAFTFTGATGGNNTAALSGPDTSGGSQFGDLAEA